VKAFQQNRRIGKRCLQQSICRLTPPFTRLALRKQRVSFFHAPFELIV
jgi:hypothetical protein